MGGQQMRSIQFTTLLVFLVGAVAASCSSDGPTAPTTGGVQVSVNVSGPDVDANGFSVVIDGSNSRTVAAGGQTTFSGLSIGQHTLQILDVADNCQPTGGDSRTVTVTAGQDASTIFTVSCDAVVAGGWSYSSDFALAGVPCTLTETLSVSQTGSSFSGNATNGWIECPLGGIDESFPGAAIVNGVSSQFSVAYDFDSSNVHHTGTYAANTMNGSVTFLLDSGPVTGTWTAVRSGGFQVVAPSYEVTGPEAPTAGGRVVTLDDIARRLRK